MTKDIGFIGEAELDREVLGYENETSYWDDDGEEMMTFNYKGRQYNEDIMDEMI